MKTIIYILFLISFSAVESGELSKSEYLRVLCLAVKKNLIAEERAFNLTKKVIAL